MDLFRQPPSISKPFVCLACRARFRFKAHAVNHRRQTPSLSCRLQGFMCDDDQTVPAIPVFSHPAAQNQQEEAVPQRNIVIQGVEPEIRVMENKNVEGDNEILPFGEEINLNEQAVKKQNLSRKGMMKCTPHKISSCLKRMEQILQSNEKLSKRAIAAKVAEEYSTAWRNCYRWK